VGRPPLRPHASDRARRGRLSRAGWVAALPGLLLLSGCTDQVNRGWLPSTRDTTNQTGRIMDMWNWSWVAALVVGVIVWGLMLWCIVAYRRRRGDTSMPAQVRYHLPLEIMYTIIPLIMVGPLFFYTARYQAAIADVSATPDVTINVVGKQWAWDFNYLTQGGRKLDVFDTGLQAELDGKPGVDKEAPTLYLPVDKRVEFTLTSRDVIHSFWIPTFLYKMDVIPGVENHFQVVPTRIGAYKGKCAELCGEYHSEMLFNVKVVSQADFDKHLADLAALGQVGNLGSNLGRSQTKGNGGYVPGNTAPPVSEGNGSN
jgi:cytochrome c oxidase subunit II